MMIEMLRINPKLYRLPLCFGHDERAEQAIKNRQDIAEVVVVMFRRDRVMNLMVRRAQQPFAPPRTQRDPKVRVLQMTDQDSTRQRKRTGAEQRER
jgi:hypothetical protein